MQLLGVMIHKTDKLTDNQQDLMEGFNKLIKMSVSAVK